MNIYKRRFINYWNAKKSEVVYTYDDNGIEYTSVMPINAESTDAPVGLLNNYTISNDEITNIKHKVFNIVDFNFGGATIPNTDIVVNDAFDLMRAIQDLKQRINILKE